MNHIEIKARWREEIEAISDEGILIFEFTIGEKHVYFPDENRWLAVVPVWAKKKRGLYLEACTKWCKENRIPLSIVGDAHVYEQKRN